VITDDTRIRAALPTIENLRAAARRSSSSHLGRPKGPTRRSRCAPSRSGLAELTGTDVDFAQDVVGPSARVPSMRLTPGGIVLLENLRFEPGETKNDDQLAAALASLADVYVNDAFGSAHRAHASTEGVTHHVARPSPGCCSSARSRSCGRSSPIPRAPARRGARRLQGDRQDRRDRAFSRDRRHGADRRGDVLPVPERPGSHGRASMCEQEGLEPARSALEARVVLARRAAAAGRSRPRRAVAADAPRRDLDGVDVPDGWMGLDIGPRTAARYAEAIAGAGTVFWNGPMGVFELDAFAPARGRSPRPSRGAGHDGRRWR
jgi:phosphoglycerate kinase